MHKLLIDKSTCGFEWLDVTNPTEEELEDIARRYGLQETAVEDCLEPDHLPKFEAMGSVNFAIVRIYNPKKDKKSDTIQDLSSKVAIFYARDFLITVHRQPQPVIELVKQENDDETFCPTTTELALQIIRAVVESYIEPAHHLTREMEECEDEIFLNSKAPDVLKTLYYLKRQCSSARRILVLTKDVINAVGRNSTLTATVQDTVDLETKALTLYDQMEDAMTHLLEIYLSLQSQRADEVMRVLTIFSAFFLPLTFIVGVYGMNFHFMPELTWKYGYYFCLGLMVAVFGAIYIWFKRKGWM
ncbi:MAG TPA: CorA family divalent cation transporter [Alphaproteobacteria bacterium]